MSRRRPLEKVLASEFVTIGELVRLTDSRYSTLKFYTEEGMLTFQQAEEKRTRRFPREKTIAVIVEIKRLRNLDFSIPEIKQMLTGE